MSIVISNGVLQVPGAQDKLRQKGRERVGFFDDYTMIDIETTGLSTYRDRITEFGAVKVRGGQVVDTYSNLVIDPKNNKVPAFITKLNGITEEKILAEGIPAEQAIHEMREFIGDDLIAGYNVNFDLNFTYDLVEKYYEPRLANDYIDVLRLARAYYPGQHNRLLDVMKRSGIAQVEQHRGLDDSLDTIKVYQDFAKYFSPEVLHKAQASIKNFDLTSKPLPIWQLGRFNPISNKKILLANDLELDLIDANLMINNLSGEAQDQLAFDTNYVIVNDWNFFSKDELNTQIKELQHSGSKVKKLTETFFLGMLDDWARS